MLAEGEPRIREEQRALSLVVALTGSSWMVLLRFTMRMFPLGFLHYGLHLQLFGYGLRHPYVLFASLLCV